MIKKAEIKAPAGLPSFPTACRSSRFANSASDFCSCLGKLAVPLVMSLLIAVVAGDSCSLISSALQIWP